MSPRHRTPLLGSLRSYPNPSSSIDPRIRLVVARLSALPAARIAPRDSFRAELRQQLVAITPRMVADSHAAAAPRLPALSRTGRTATPTPLAEPAAPPRRRLRRPLIALLAATALFVLMLGGAILRSGDTLPGDSLYSLKRASENLQLSLLSGDAARGEKYLDLAGDRADEVRSLLSRDDTSALGTGPQAAGEVSAHTAGLVTSTLDNEDSDVRDGTRLLTSDTASTGNVGPLDSMIAWSPSQLTKLNEIADELPAGQLHQRVLGSVATARTALTRAEQIRAAADSRCLASAPTDAYGPLPVTQCANPTPATKASPTPSPGGLSSLPVQQNETTAKNSTGAPAPPASGISLPSTDRGSSAAGTSTPAQSTTAPGSGLALPTLPGLVTLPTLPDLPTLPTLPTLPSLPITTSSCGLTVSLSPLGSINLGSCGPLISLAPGQ